MTKQISDDGRELFHCPVQATMSVIGGKYKAVILHYLRQDGALRFSQLERRIPYATHKVLAQQLRELERDDIVARTVFASVPPRTEYRLTARGKSLAPVIEAICDWGRTNMADSIVLHNKP